MGGTGTNKTIGTNKRIAMKNKLLVSTAVLLAGLGCASAQNMPAGKESGGGAAMQNQGRGAEGKGAESRDQAQPKRETTGQSRQTEQSSPSQSPRDQDDRSKQAQPQREQTTGQSRPRDQGKQAQPQRDQTTGQAKQSDQGKQAQPQRDQSAGQAKQGEPGKQAQPQPSQPSTTGQAPQPQQPQTGQAAPAQQGQASQAGSVTLSAEQRTQVRQQILARADVPRVTNVNFAISVGTTVPQHVRVVAVPQVLIIIRPEFRDHLYFVVYDDIVIVDRSHRIVAVLPAGDRVGSAGEPSGVRAGSSGGGSHAMVMDLTRDEIRQVQLILIQKGFNVGEADGTLGPRTRQALIMFQRRQGFEATGNPDNRTIVALGVNIRGGASANQPATGGAGAGAQQSPANQAAPANQPSNQGAGQQPSTTGQSPSPTGQGGDAGRQPPAAQGGTNNNMGNPPASAAPQSNPGGGGSMPSGQSQSSGQSR
jgi:hypothetical protein